MILAGFGYQGIARLKPGVTIAQANADLARLIPIWMDSWSNGPGTNSRFYETWRITPAIRPLKQEVIGNIGSVLWIVMATIGIVMLIACANVANLLLVRAEARQQELAIRAALGAGRGRIVRELLVESVMLGLLGGALGIGLAYWGLQLLAAMGPANLPRLNEISLDARALGFTLALSLLSSLLLGAIPALKYSGPRISQTLRSAGRTASVSRERHRSRDFLVMAQMAMALVLLVSAGLMIRTSRRWNCGAGIHACGAPRDDANLYSSFAHRGAATSHAIQNDIADHLAAIPGVVSVGFASAMPMEGVEPTGNKVIRKARPPGRSHRSGCSRMSRLVFFERQEPGWWRARTHLDQRLQPKTCGAGFRESGPRIMAHALRRDRQTISGV